MLRSLYSGISGLRAHQTMLDVTGNNIANVNTTGFKASATVFQDTLSEMTRAASGPQAQIGGSNPAQVGLGVQVAGISTNFAQGATETTGRSTDLLISGDGFFVTSLGGEALYTRAGALSFDADHRLVTTDGALVQGWTAQNGKVNAGGPTSNIILPMDAVSPAGATTSATLAGNLPSDAADGTALTRDIVVYDQAGNPRALTLTFSRTANPGEWAVTGDDVTASVPAGTTITFKSDGTLNAGGFTVDGITVDASSLTGYAGLNTISISGQNGREGGTLQSFTLSKDGTLVGSFSNGDLRPIAQIAMANFANPAGLEKAGASSYRATFNSGTATVGIAGTGGLGSLVSGSLEGSNVDLSQEFTNLIIAQRGFQANARIITTSDEVLQELTNLKR